MEFDMFFSLDPHHVSKSAFRLLACLIIIPNTIAGLYDTVRGVHAGADVAVLTRTEYNSSGIKFVPTYLICCSLLNLALNYSAYIIIPIVLKVRQPGYNDQLLERTKTLKKYIWWCAGSLLVIICSIVLDQQHADSYRRIKISSHVFTCVAIIIMTYYLVAGEARFSVQKYLRSLFHIEENRTVPEDDVRGFDEQPDTPETTNIRLQIKKTHSTIEGFDEHLETPMSNQTMSTEVTHNEAIIAVATCRSDPEEACNYIKVDNC